MPSGPPPSDEPMPTRIGVLLAEDDPGMQTALRALLAEDPALEVLAVAADADEAIALAEQHRPDVCIVDVGMPGGGGPRATRVIRERGPGTEVLALSGHDDRGTVVEMLRAGACGYLVKAEDLDELLEAVHAAARGERPLSRQVAGGVVGELADHLAREDEAELLSRARTALFDRILERRSYAMVFQPVVDLRGGGILFFEALARFTAEPLRGPDAWLAEAAQAGRLVELELALAQAAFAHLPALPEATSLSVNVSPVTAARDELLAAIPRGGGDRVLLEITEHAPVDDYDALVPCIDRLREKGVRLAIDDAGAGFASLRHILKLTPDVIKTDMTLTRNIEHHRAERALTRALLAFASEMETTIVAEGIETHAEIEALKELGVTHGQGFHLGRPGPLRRWRRSDARAAASGA